MIGYLKGKVIHCEEGRLLLGVGSSDQVVGYELRTPTSLSFAKGKSCELFVHTYVREDALELFGFSSPMEKTLFTTAISVSGVGPKVALALLSSLGVSEVLRAVLDADLKALSSVPGVGKRTAERLVVELKVPIAKKVESGALRGGQSSPVGASTQDSSVLQDARSALQSLGYKSNEIDSLMKSVPPDCSSVEDVVKIALRSM